MPKSIKYNITFHGMETQAVDYKGVQIVQNCLNDGWMLFFSKDGKYPNEAPFAEDMSEHESDTFRQYSPFEFFAHEINQSKYHDELWDAYDNSVWAGIWKAIKEFKRNNRNGFKKLEVEYGMGV